MTLSDLVRFFVLFSYFPDFFATFFIVVLGFKIYIGMFSFLCLTPVLMRRLWHYFLLARALILLAGHLRSPPDIFRNTPNAFRTVPVAFSSLLEVI